MVVFLHHEPGHWLWLDEALFVLVPLIAVLTIVGWLRRRSGLREEDN